MRRSGPDTTIAATRLSLAPPRARDFAEWSALRGASRGFLEPWEPSWPPDALTRADWQRRLKAWSAAWRSGTAFVFLLRRHTDQALIGGASLTHVRGWPADSATLGYWLGERFTGEGYMQDAVIALSAWAFTALDLARIDAGIVPGNAASRRVLEAAGFTEEGFARAYLEIAGTRRDHILFGLVRPPDRR